MKDGSEKSIKEYLKIMQREYEKQFNEEIVDLKWREIVGDVLYPHVKLLSILLNEMTVEIDHPSYKSAFLLKQNIILSNLNRLFPKYEIKKIKIQQHRY